MINVLSERTVIELKGNYSNFLNGILTNNLDDKVSYSALLTPQGKIITDLFCYKISDDNLLIDIPNKAKETLLQRLKIYKIGHKVEIIARDNLKVFVEFNALNNENDFKELELNNCEILIKGNDPRHSNFGARGILNSENLDLDNDNNQELSANKMLPANEWLKFRVNQTIFETEYDLIIDNTFPHDIALDLLNGISFKKGCYVGQEVISRIYHKGNVRKRPLIISFKYDDEINNFENLTLVDNSENEIEIGIITSNCKVGENLYKAIAIARFDRIEKALNSNGVKLKELKVDALKIEPPQWADYKI